MKAESDARDPRTLLIVDDDSTSRDALTGWFRSHDWQVQIATGCDEAIGMARRATFAYAIIEQRLADGSGLDLFLHLCAINQHLRAVILTRYPSVAAAVRAIRIGFRDYLPKPVQREQLAQAFDLHSQPAPAGEARKDEAATSLARMEWEHIHAVLFTCGGNVSAAARRLRIPRRSLQRKLQRLAPP